MSHPPALPALVIADSDGRIREFPELAMAGMVNGRFIQPALEDLIPLPEGSELFSLPDRLPVGTDPSTGEPLLLPRDPARPEEPITAVAAFMAPAHTAVCSAAFQSEDSPVLLPLFAYTAVGWLQGRFWVAGFRSDPDRRQDQDQFKQSTINRKTRKKLERHRNNRLIQHLGKCCLSYHCPAARNYFLGRWEAPLPTSPSCNARCVGCISRQPENSCSSTQNRLEFIPSIQEVCEVAVPHLRNAPAPIVSFGQGCEGEPLLQGRLLEQVIDKIRKDTTRGTINLNSNASLPEVVQRLATAGLDSIRVSLNSAQEKYYDRYYRPRGYRFAGVLESIRTMKKAGRFVSLNYFIFPGFTDSRPETDALCSLIQEFQPDFIQLRNLNMDPEWYIRTLGQAVSPPPHGMRNWLQLIQTRFPNLGLGYYNPCLSP